MSNTEIYEQLAEISRRLRTSGLDVWAERLDDARLGGSTSGEILMAARWILSELRVSKAAMSADILDSADLAISAINALGI